MSKPTILCSIFERGGRFCNTVSSRDTGPTNSNICAVSRLHNYHNDERDII